MDAPQDMGMAKMEGFGQARPRVLRPTFWSLCPLFRRAGSGRSGLSGDAHRLAGVRMAAQLQMTVVVTGPGGMIKYFLGGTPLAENRIGAAGKIGS